MIVSDQPGHQGNMESSARADKVRLKKTVEGPRRSRSLSSLEADLWGSYNVLGTASMGETKNRKDISSSFRKGDSCYPTKLEPCRRDSVSWATRLAKVAERHPRP